MSDREVRTWWLGGGMWAQIDIPHPSPALSKSIPPHHTPKREKTMRNTPKRDKLRPVALHGGLYASRARQKRPDSPAPASTPQNAKAARTGRQTRIPGEGADHVFITPFGPLYSSKRLTRAELAKAKAMAKRAQLLDAAAQVPRLLQVWDRHVQATAIECSRWWRALRALERRR
jgi:hypothetical protein